MSEDDDLLTEARDRMKRAVDADKDNRIDALDDLKVLAGVGHWYDEMRKARETDNRPCLVVNMLPQFFRQVTGDIRNMNPGVKISPSDGTGDKLTAEAFEGIIRHVINRSDGSSVFERAAESAAACGMGYFRILTEYAHEDSFNQDMRLETIHNPFSVYFDPDAMMPTRQDAEWVFVTESMSQDDFTEQWPDASVVAVANDGMTDQMQHWRTGTTVVVAEYFWKERTPSTLYQMPDGSVITDPKKPPKGFLAMRKGTKTTVKWAKISGNDVLEGPSDFPGKDLPVIAVMGEELYTGERIYRSSVIRHAKDQQRIYNYTWSSMMESLALQTKAPWLATPTQIAGFEDQWADPEANRTTLLYNYDPLAGPPSRIQPAVASQGMTNVLMIAAQDLRATTGIQDAALGKQSGEHSGVAIRQRQMESDNATSIYADNMGKAIEHCGRVLVNIIPEVIDTPQTVRVLGVEGDATMVPVNQSVTTAQGPVTIDLKKGRYDVEVNVGPNYATKKQAAAEGMMQFIQANPNAGMLIGDLVAANMDWPGADAIAERLKKGLQAQMPGVVEDDQQGQPNPQQMQAMQAQQQDQQRQAEGAKIGQELEIRIQNAKAMEAEARAQQAQAQALKAQIEARAAGQAPAPQPA